MSNNLNNPKILKKRVNLAKKILKNHKNKYKKINLKGCKCKNKCNRVPIICYKNKNKLIKSMELNDNDIIYATPINIEQFMSGNYKHIFKGTTLWGHGHFILNYHETNYYKKQKALEKNYKLILNKYKDLIQ